MGGTFSYMSPLTSPTSIPSVTPSCSVVAGAGDFGGGGFGDRSDKDQKGLHDGLCDQRCVLRGKEVV